jgi:hypothetical protein
MGARKKISAENRKVARKTMYFAKLQECSYLSAENASRGWHDSWYGSDPCTGCLEVFFYTKLLQEWKNMLRSRRIANWEQKNERKAEMCWIALVTKIYVDGGATLKRMRPSPQGRRLQYSVTFKSRTFGSWILRVANDNHHLRLDGHRKLLR